MDSRYGGQLDNWHRFEGLIMIEMRAFALQQDINLARMMSWSSKALQGRRRRSEHGQSPICSPDMAGSIFIDWLL